MPTLKQKLTGFVRQHFGSVHDITEPSAPDSAFVWRYLKREGKDLRPLNHRVYYSRNGEELPPFTLGMLDNRVFAAQTGPDGGLTAVNSKEKHVSTDEELGFIDDDESGWDAGSLDSPCRRELERAFPRSGCDSSTASSAPPWTQAPIMDGAFLAWKSALTKQKLDGNKSGFSSRPFDLPISASGHRDSLRTASPSDEERLVSPSPAAKLACSEVVPEDPPLQRNGRVESSAEEPCIAGITGGWNRPSPGAFGISDTLYERNPKSSIHAGHPIADAFAVVARGNSCVMALADGVNWGEKAAIAAKCAVHGSVQYLNEVLFCPRSPPPRTTKDVFIAILRGFHMGHNLILEEKGMLTTLTVGCVVPLRASSVSPPRNSHHQSPKPLSTPDEVEQHAAFGLCVVNVGDSLCYVYSKNTGKVREVTMGSHDIHSMRDMRDALGALGPVDGLNPELNNLTCSFTVVDPGDIVFLTSDGVSDNFDPVVGKFALASPPPPTSASGNSHEQSSQKATNSSSGPKERKRRPVSAPSTSQKNKSSVASPLKERNTASLTNNPTTNSATASDSLPVVAAHQRHGLTLHRMEQLLFRGGPSAKDQPCQTAEDLCRSMLGFAKELTTAKRKVLEDPELYASPANPQGDGETDKHEFQKRMRRRVCEKLAQVPGKLDHATVVAYEVGFQPVVSE